MTQTNDLQVKLDELKTHKLPTGVLGVASDKASWNAGEGRIFAACMDGGIYQCSPDSGDFEKLTSHKSYASGVAAPDTLQADIVSAGYDGRLLWTSAGDRSVRHDVKAHNFWSWKLKASADGRMVASASGQYLSGGYKYEPAPEQEPSVKVYERGSARLLHAFSHLPPVLSVAFSPDNRFLAAGNMMGDVKVWDLQTGEIYREWNTPDFTSWGVIKSHHYIGGIFDLCFTPDSTGVLCCGMGPMRDPMAGNGRQTWQLFDISTGEVEKKLEIKDDQRGRGLMEAIAFHPSGSFFVMAGRLAQGQWNLACFNPQSGENIHNINTKDRITSIDFSPDGRILVLGGATGQGGKKDGQWPHYGRIRTFSVQM